MRLSGALQNFGKNPFMKKFLTLLGLSISSASCVHAAERTLLKSALPVDPSGVVLFTDVTGDGTPDILESWWNGKRCRWFDENGDMRPTDVRGDRVDDSMQVDMDGDGAYDGPEDMNIKWSDR